MFATEDRCSRNMLVASTVTIDNIVCQSSLLFCVSPVMFKLGN